MRQGVPTALDALVRRHTRPLLNYGRKTGSGDDEIKDSLQEIFADLWTRRDRLETVQSVRAYLFMALRNRLLKTHRTAVRRAELPDETDELPFPLSFSVEEQWIADEAEGEQLRRLNAQLNALPPRQREAIYLKYYQNLTNEEIAGLLKINYQSVSNLLHRALFVLRNELAELLLPLGWLLGSFS